MFSRKRQTVLPEAFDLPTPLGLVSVQLRQDARAKRYLLRLPADNSGPVLTIPRGGSYARAKRFARDHTSWLVARMEQRPQPVAFAEGGIIPFRGEDHLIQPTGSLRGLVSTGKTETGQAVVFVPGAPDHLPRKLTNWLKEQARETLSEASQMHAAKIGKPIRRITVRDTTSRWGSCSSTGALSFSWRLILAPPDILDYVAAHEVAHLKEMNHSARFWRLCEELAPQTPHARQWLKENGNRLHGYG